MRHVSEFLAPLHHRWKRAEGQSLAAVAPVFVSRNGNRLSARQLRERFAQWQEKAGVERPCTEIAYEEAGVNLFASCVKG